MLKFLLSPTLLTLLAVSIGLSKPTLDSQTNIDLELFGPGRPLISHSPGQPMSIFVNMRNNGTDDAIGYGIDFYFSLDETLDVSDYKIYYESATHSSYLLAGGESKEGWTLHVSSLLEIPPAGEYYVIIKLNPDQNIEETNYDNNTQTSYNTIAFTTPVLTFEHISTSQAFTTDESISISYAATVQNDGISVANYLSVPTNFSIQIKNTDGITIFATTTSDFTNINLLYPYPYDAYGYFLVPLGDTELAEGTYTIEVSFSCISSPPYHVECNNSTLTTQLIVNRSPSISIETATFNAEYNDLNSVFGLTVELKNVGENSFSNTGQNYTIEFENEQGVIVKTVHINRSITLNQGQSLVQTWVLNLTDPLPAGHYTVHIECHTGTRCFTTPFALNFQVKESVPLLQVGMSFPDDLTTADDKIDLLALIINYGKSTSNLLQEYTLTLGDTLGNVLFTQNISESITLNYQQSTTYAWQIILPQPLDSDYYRISIACTNSENCFTLPQERFDFFVHEKYFDLVVNTHDENQQTVTSGTLFLYRQGKDSLELIDTRLVTDELIYRINPKPHTLYYLPDSNNPSNHIPTIFNASLFLTPESFFKLRSDSTITFEILSLTGTTTGPNEISGNVFTNSSSGRLKDIIPLTNLPIVLLSETNTPLRLTHTNPQGEYTFEQIGNGTFNVVLLFKPIDFSMNEPIAVNVNNNNAIVDFTFTGTSIETVIETITSTESDIFKNLRIYPNPVVDKLVIENETHADSMEILDVLGRKKLISLKTGMNEINMQEYPPGLLLLQIRSNHNNTGFYKILKSN
ncbi:MAG: T9SS type A sorting domain-containing protein [Cyclobacteriaceae bacterium]|nr:MAG: T9SS type A sorting domain-containing protein [Cyclobacteriaceae bacterium]